MISRKKEKIKKCSFSDPFIYVKDGVLSKEFCESVFQKFEEDSGKVPGKISNFRIDETVKKSTDLSISDNVEWKKEDSIFYESLKHEYINYTKKIKDTIEGSLVGDYFDNLVDVGYQIHRTKPGEFYIYHHDFNVKTIRFFTYIWYLNDVKDGGYTEFIDGTKIQPKTGRILIFPATWTYIHRGYPPETETKYICTGWLSVHKESRIP